MPTETLQIVYSSYFHSLMTHGNIFWSNSSFSMQIFRIQKRIIRVMSGLRPRDSCREAFKDWGIVPLQSQYIFSLLIFLWITWAFIIQHHKYMILTRRNFDLYHSQTNLSICQRWPYYFGIKLFNHLPLTLSLRGPRLPHHVYPCVAL
jgi:hypothetical protein